MWFHLCWGNNCNDFLGALYQMLGLLASQHLNALQCTTLNNAPKFTVLHCTVFYCTLCHLFTGCTKLDCPGSAGEPDHQPYLQCEGGGSQREYIHTGPGTGCSVKLTVCYLQFPTDNFSCEVLCAGWRGRVVILKTSHKMSPTYVELLIDSQTQEEPDY